MGYNIEVSFNTLKHSCIMETRDMIINLALENGCESYYDTIEFINDQFETRNHNVITINFKENNIDQIVKFLRLVKDIRGMYIETIYDDLTEQLLFASKYYLTHTIDKYLVNKPKLNRRERSYSEDDTIIINTMQQKTKKKMTI